MERREKERATTGRNGGRDTVEEKKSSSQPAIQEQEGGARTRPHTHYSAHHSLTHTPPAYAHSLTHSLTHTRTGLHTVRSAYTTKQPPARPRGEPEGKGKEGEEGDPLASGALYADWTRIGCRTGKGRLLSVLTDPAALVPDRGGTVDQSHALACRSTAHLVCNPHALPPRAPASLPTLPPDLQTCRPAA